MVALEFCWFVVGGASMVARRVGVGLTGVLVLKTPATDRERTGDEDDVYDDEDREDERVLFDVSENNQTEAPFYWSSALQDNFREELEKCVSHSR